jgi:hypothetical protein
VEDKELEASFEDLFLDVSSDWAFELFKLCNEPWTWSVITMNY